MLGLVIPWNRNLHNKPEFKSLRWPWKVTNLKLKFADAGMDLKGKSCKGMKLCELIFALAKIYRLGGCTLT